MPVTERTFHAIALEDPGGHWELHHGRLREKPTMTWITTIGPLSLADQLTKQLDCRDFRVRHNAGRLRRQESTYYIPDVFVIPTNYGDGTRRASKCSRGTRRTGFAGG